MPTNFQIPEFLRDYIGLIAIEILQPIGVFLIFVMVVIVLRRVRSLNDEVAALQGHVQQLLMNEQRRSLTEFRVTRQTAPDPAETAMKLAVTEIELRSLKEMATELRQARDDWKAEAGRASHGPAPITAPAPPTTPSAPAPEATSAVGKPPQ